MLFNVILILVVLIAACVGYTGYIMAKETSPTKTELISQLKQLSPLEGTKSPEGAMCYDVSTPLKRVQYRCPICGEMTLYNTFYENNVDLIAPYRMLTAKITKLDVKLDESQFCKKCSPHIKSPEFCLIVKADKNAMPHKTCGIVNGDIELLYDYSEGKKEHYNEPIAKYTKRLQELLGIDLKENGK